MSEYSLSLIFTWMCLTVIVILYRIVFGKIVYRAVGNTLGWDLLLFGPVFLAIFAGFHLIIRDVTQGWIQPSSILLGFAVVSLLDKPIRTWMKNKLQQLSEGNFFTD